MTRWKKRLAGFLIAVSALCIGTGLGTVQNVQAATKASYTIKKIQEKKTYKNSSDITVIWATSSALQIRILW